ncbi:hypothetical protein ABPG72_022756 [Tetrahymena utriculariae]
MGNCCSNNDDRPDQGFHQNQCVNYGPLKRDEEDTSNNLPNTLTFGQPVKVEDRPIDFQAPEFIHDGHQLLTESRISQREPVEKSFMAVITSPEKNMERSNRIRIINQVEQNNFVSEPLTDTQKDTRCMELNKNLKTPQLSNSFYRGSNVNTTQERPFYNAATNQNQQASQYYQVNATSSYSNQIGTSNVQPAYNGYQQQQYQTSQVRYSQAQQAAPINNNSNLIHNNNPIIKSLNFS